MMDCVFCRIAKGEISSTVVYEDERVVAFLDISPLNWGHTLVVPKSHCCKLWECQDEDLAALARAVKKLVLAVQQAVDADGINVVQNNGRAAEQIVPHVHFHVIPRFDGDGYELPHSKKSYGQGEAEELGKRIAEKLGAGGP